MSDKEDLRLWYAVLKDKDDKDYSIGSYDEDEAEEISKRPEYDPNTVQIAEVLFYGSDWFFVLEMMPPLWRLKQIVW